MAWILGVTEAGKEEWAQENVRRLGYDTYLPKFREPRLDRDKKLVPHVSCLFPRYLFIDTPGEWYLFLTTFGMAGVVKSGDTPIVMPDRGIVELKSREDAEGYVELPERLRVHRPKVRRYAKGQKLKCTHGPLVGYEGVCMGDKAQARIWVLFQYLGRVTPVLVDRENLVAA